MTLVRSRYLILSGQTYRDPAGRSVRLAYSARQGKLLALDEETALGLQTGLVPADTSALEEAEALVPEGQDELSVVLGRLRGGSVDPSTRGFTIMPTSYCNMGCEYCGQEHFKSAVDTAAVERVAARVEAAFAAEQTKRVAVTWFGGEPLLALRVVRELSARFVAASRATGKGYSAKMATNGSLLTKRTLKFLHDDCRVVSMDITIDGPQQVHDRRRIKRNGIGSFHHTVAVLGEAVREKTVPGLTIGIRVNIDNENEEHVPDLLVDLACLGLADRQVELHLMPVHSWGNDVSKVELEARGYAAREVQWLHLAEELGLTVKLLPNTPKRTTCRATSTSGEIIDAQQRVYSCSEHPLVPGARDSGVIATLSSLVGAQPRPAGAFDDWYDQVGDGVQSCGRCPLLPVCGGSCPKLWREGHLPCPSMKFNFAERVEIVARRMGYHADV